MNPDYRGATRTGPLCCFVHELNRIQNVLLVGLNYTAIHDHLLQHKMRLLQMEHDVQFTLTSNNPQTNANSQGFWYQKYNLVVLQESLQITSISTMKLYCNIIRSNNNHELQDTSIYKAK